MRSSSDARFAGSSADLWCIETIDIADAVLGTRPRVPTVDGSVKVSVPRGRSRKRCCGCAARDWPISAAGAAISICASGCVFRNTFRPRKAICTSNCVHSTHKSRRANESTRTILTQIKAAIRDSFIIIS
ncbi:MAG TPA: hypothetical protein VEI74_11665 [Candidatus Methylomirabilis sp.]|nr:hypothetical protein [Candidatus Methylomirabilis sp.]